MNPRKPPLVIIFSLALLACVKATYIIYETAFYAVITDFSSSVDISISQLEDIEVYGRYLAASGFMLLIFLPLLRALRALPAYNGRHGQVQVGLFFYPILLIYFFFLVFFAQKAVVIYVTDKSTAEQRSDAYYANLGKWLVARGDISSENAPAPFGSSTFGFEDAFTYTNMPLFNDTDSMRTLFTDGSNSTDRALLDGVIATNLRRDWIVFEAAQLKLIHSWNLYNTQYLEAWSLSQIYTSSAFFNAYDRFHKEYMSKYAEYAARSSRTPKGETLFYPPRIFIPAHRNADQFLELPIRVAAYRNNFRPYAFFTGNPGSSYIAEERRFYAELSDLLDRKLPPRDEVFNNIGHYAESNFTFTGIMAQYPDFPTHRLPMNIDEFFTYVWAPRAEKGLARLKLSFLPTDNQVFIRNHRKPGGAQNEASTYINWVTTGRNAVKMMFVLPFAASLSAFMAMMNIAGLVAGIFAGAASIFFSRKVAILAAIPVFVITFVVSPLVFGQYDKSHPGVVSIHDSIPGLAGHASIASWATSAHAMTYQIGQWSLMHLLPDLKDRFVTPYDGESNYFPATQR